MQSKPDLQKPFFILLALLIPLTACNTVEVMIEYPLTPDPQATATFEALATENARMATHVAAMLAPTTLLGEGLQPNSVWPEPTAVLAPIRLGQEIGSSSKTGLRRRPWRTIQGTLTCLLGAKIRQIGCTLNKYLERKRRCISDKRCFGS